MVIIRLARSGSKKNPYYFITVADEIINCQRQHYKICRLNKMLVDWHHRWSTLSGKSVPLLLACLREDSKHTLLVLRGLLGRAVGCELLFVTFAVPICIADRV